jgi:hypothetical protein
VGVLGAQIGKAAVGAIAQVCIYVIGGVSECHTMDMLVTIMISITK